MTKIEELEKRIEEIERRNRRVEVNKAWETSYTRRALIIIFTYLAIALYFLYTLNVDPWMNAIVPTIGFLLSTLSLPYFKRIWERMAYKKSKKI